MKKIKPFQQTNNRVFLGGTCNGSTWRDSLIKMVQMDMFNPVVEEWTPECQEIEKIEKEEKCNIHLYVITNEMTGVFSIAEAVDSVHNDKVRTILHVIPDGFDDHQKKSLSAVVDLINLRGGIAYMDSDLERTAKTLNTFKYPFE